MRYGGLFLLGAGKSPPPGSLGSLGLQIDEDTCMRSKMRLPHRAALLAAALLAAGAAPAAADCRADLLSTQQNLQTTRGALEGGAKAPAAQQCPAYRRHYGALVRA